MKVKLKKKPRKDTRKTDHFSEAERYLAAKMQELANIRESKRLLRDDNVEVFDKWSDLCDDEQGVMAAVKGLVKELGADDLPAGTRPFVALYGQAVIVQRRKVYNAERLMKRYPNLMELAKVNMKLSGSEVDRLRAAGVITADDAEDALDLQTQISIKQEMEESV